MRRACQQSPARAASRAITLLTSAAALALSGCVDRVLQIRSEPPGATVSIHGVDVGVTPLDHEFDFYGSHGIVVRKNGYRSVRVVEELEAPWYEHFPLDFFAENIVPWTMRDEHRVDVTLEMTEPDPENELSDVEQRAEEARGEARRIAEEVEAPLRARSGGGD